MNLTIYLGEQRTDQWRELRRAIPTASNFSAVMAEGRTKGSEAVTRRDYRIALALEEITGVVVEKDFSGNKAIKDGIEREPVAAMLYEMQTGTDLEHVCFIRNEELGAGCSPDGLVGDIGLIEIKAPQEAAHLDYLDLDGKAPSAYQWQVQGSMLVTGRRFCDFVSFNPNFPPELQLHVTRVHRDEAAIESLRKGLHQFKAEVDWTVAHIRHMAQKRAA